MSNLNCSNSPITERRLESQGESLSALVDDQTQQFELYQVLKQSATDDDLRARWARYQVASLVLRRQLSSDAILADSNLANRVRAAIENEAPPHLTSSTDESTDTNGIGTNIKPKSSSGVWKQASIGFAMAVSVTMIMVFGAQQLMTPTTHESLPVDTSIALVEPISSIQQFQIASTGSATSAKSNGSNIMLRSSIDPNSPNTWQLTLIPEGYRIIQQGQRTDDDITSDVLVYTNGTETFSVYIEPLNGRHIPEGYTFSGDSLILGKQLDIAGQQHFVTLVGALPITTANQVVASVTTK